MTIISIHKDNRKGNKRCDQRCYGAKHSKKCTCLCNGENHGKGLQTAINNTVTNHKNWVGQETGVKAVKTNVKSLQKMIQTGYQFNILEVGK